jgi:endoglucanase
LFVIEKDFFPREQNFFNLVCFKTEQMWRHVLIIVLFVSKLTWGYGQWSTRENQIFFKDQSYPVKGINWFGAETGCRVPHGMWVHSLEDYLDQMRRFEFNSIRIPFSYENARNMDALVEEGCVPMSPSLSGKTFRQALHIIIGGARYRNMTVLLDFHTIGGVITEFPSYPGAATEEEFLDTWKKVLWEYGDYPNVLGVDLKNEPHGNIRWPLWGDFVQRAIAVIESEVPRFRGLFFVEGIQDPNDHSVWGGSFSKIDNTLGEIPHPRIVFSPHVYGVSVRGEVALGDRDQDWDEWFAFIQRKYTNPLCIGEIGGWFEGDDEMWHDRVLDYLKRLGIHNAFYWCLNPNSVDTGGILDFDWTTVNTDKIDFCQELQPSPAFPSF